MDIQFPVNPVSTQEEALNVDLDGIDTTNKWDKLNGIFGAKCTNVQFVTKEDGTKEYHFEFVGTEGAAAALTFTRRIKFPDFADMLLATAGAFGVKPVKNETTGKTNLPLEQCKGQPCQIELKRKASTQGKVFTNIVKVLAPKAGTTTPAGGPQIL
jgi:hypothetical protein